MPEMKPGDIRAFKKGEGNALVLALGVWADKDTAGWIRIDLTGPKDFHTTVTNNPKSERFHSTELYFAICDEYSCRKTVGASGTMARKQKLEKRNSRCLSLRVPE